MWYQNLELQTNHLHLKVVSVLHYCCQGLLVHDYGWLFLCIVHIEMAKTFPFPNVGSICGPLLCVYGMRVSRIRHVE